MGTTAAGRVKSLLLSSITVAILDKLEMISTPSMLYWTVISYFLFFFQLYDFFLLFIILLFHLQDGVDDFK